MVRPSATIVVKVFPIDVPGRVRLQVENHGVQLSADEVSSILQECSEQVLTRPYWIMKPEDL